MRLPKYIIERVNGLWELYQTVDCITYSFDTKELAENYLNKLI